MFADQLRKKHQKHLLILAFAVILTTIVFMAVISVYPDYLRLGMYILALVLFLMIGAFVVGINIRNRKLSHLKYRIKTLEYKVPFPSSFKKQLRTLLIDGKRGYTINKEVIPARFVEFVEGKRAYLIKEIESINPVNEYSVLCVHKHTYALIEDVDKKKWIVHMNCLEPIGA